MKRTARARPVTITRGKVAGLRKIARHIKKNASRDRFRSAASGLLSKLEGYSGDAMQVWLTRDELDIYTFVVTEFPSLDEGQQLELLSQEERLNIPDYVIPESDKPKLKAELTEEEKDRREGIGLSREIGGTPRDAEGRALSEVISELGERTAKRDKIFGGKGVLEVKGVEE